MPRDVGIQSVRWGRRPRSLARHAALLVVALLALATVLIPEIIAVAPAQAASAPPTVTVMTDELASGAPFWGLGVELDPYDSVQPTPVQWSLIFQRLDFMHPGFIRVVEPASDYFGGYDANHNPVFRWSAPHVQQLLTILGYAQSRGITVVLGDWSNPMIGGDARIPAEFLQQLHSTYGYTVIRYYNLLNEPNYQPSCNFGCWDGIARALSSEFAGLGLNSWLSLVGPDNGNSWDDTQTAQATDRSSGLDGDNPLGGDSWVTQTLHTFPSLIGAYDSHRYATAWGIENGVYGDQVRARREQISNLDSPAKPYFAGEVGLVARQVSPFATSPDLTSSALARAMDPSVPRASPFVDSQPHIGEFDYGVWMGDMMVQAIGAGLAGASAWDLDDAMHVGGHYGSQNLKQWGFWNSLGGQDGYPASDLQLRPWYYAWSVLSRSFPAGSQPLLTPSTGIAGVRVDAAKLASGRRYYLSFAVVNDSDTPQSVTLTVPSAQTPLTLARYDYFNGDRPTDVNGFPVPAQVLQAVQLMSGLTVQLPSRGLVVLTSIGAGSPIALSDGRRPLLDNLTDWRNLRGHSKGLKFDQGNPAAFDDDGSRVMLGPKAKGAQFLIYRAKQMTSFALHAYFRTTLGINAYRSQDGKVWIPVPIASTNPAPTIGGQWYLADVVPNEPIPAGTNRLKIVLGKGTELGQVAIGAGRAGPACLARGVQARPNALAGIALATGERRVRGLFGVPTVRGPRTWRYCVVGGGEIAVVFTSRRTAALIASTAPSFHPAGIGPGSSVASLRNVLRRGGLVSIHGRIFIATRRVGEPIFITRAGRVEAVAIATPAVLGTSRSLVGAIRRTRL